MIKYLSTVFPIFLSLTLMSLPLYVIRCKSFSVCVSPIPFTFLEVLIIVTFLIWLLLKLKTNKPRKILKEFNQKIPLILKILFIVFLLSPLVSIIFSGDKSGALGIYKAYFLEPFLLFFVIYDYLISSKNLKLVFWSLIFSGFWISLLAVGEKMINYSPFDPAELATRGRAAAVYSTSNAPGLLIGPLVLLLLGYGLYIYKNDIRDKVNILSEKLLLVISIIILLLGLYSSGSRGAFFGIFVAVLLFIFYILYSKFARKTQVKVIYLFKTVVILFFMVNLLFFINIGYFSKLANKNQTNISPSLLSRICLWEGSVNVIKQSPILGSGLNGFQSAHNKNKTCNNENLIYPHNIFLNFWTETGVLGLISFLGICCYFFINLLNYEKINYLNLGIIGAFIEILFHGLLDVPYFKNDLSVLFWVILAIGLYQISQTKGFTTVRYLSGSKHRP